MGIWSTRLVIEPLAVGTPHVTGRLDELHVCDGSYLEIADNFYGRDYLRVNINCSPGLGGEGQEAVISREQASRLAQWLADWLAVEE